MHFTDTGRLLYFCLKYVFLHLFYFQHTVCLKTSVLLKKSFSVSTLKLCIFRLCCTAKLIKNHLFPDFFCNSHLFHCLFLFFILLNLKQLSVSHDVLQFSAPLFLRTRHPIWWGNPKIMVRKSTRNVFRPHNFCHLLCNSIHASRRSHDLNTFLETVPERFFPPLELKQNYRKKYNKMPI